MVLTPLTTEQAETLVSGWLADQLPTEDAESRPAADEVAGWLDWHESDLAFVVDVTLPPEIITDVGGARIRVPRLDVPVEEDASASLVETATDPTELRLVVDRRTGQVAAAQRAAPVPHVLELWRETKDLDDDIGRLPSYDPRVTDPQA